jgi:SAM-dependent methyltransferase
MFSFMRDHLKVSHEHAVEHYLLHGRQTTELFCELVAEYGGARGPATLLEFASGYGCVTRFLIDACPNTDITCCDIHPAAVAFLQSEFGVDAVLSNKSPEQVSIDRTFDVVFVVSLFSHLPKATWTRWLRSISRCVAKGGLLIFTTHGYTSASANFASAEINDEGYWFHPASEQADIDPEEYGSTITTPKFVHKQVASIHDLRVVGHRPGGLQKNQDVYILKRLPPWRVLAPLDVSDS